MSLVCKLLCFAFPHISTLWSFLPGSITEHWPAYYFVGELSLWYRLSDFWKCLKHAQCTQENTFPIFKIVCCFETWTNQIENIVGYTDSATLCNEKERFKNKFMLKKKYLFSLKVWCCLSLTIKWNIRSVLLKYPILFGIWYN